jgi:hypothetical protein
MSGLCMSQGGSGSGKTTFLNSLFLTQERVDADAARAAACSSLLSLHDSRLMFTGQIRFNGLQLQEHELHALVVYCCIRFLVFTHS